MAVKTYANAMIKLADGASWLEFQMLPESIAVAKSADWTAVEILGRSEPYRAYRASSPRSISFTMRFFASVDQGDAGDPFRDIRVKADWLESLTYPDATNGYPPVVWLLFGNTIRSRCIVKSVNVKFEGPWQLKRPLEPTVDANTPVPLALTAGLAGLGAANLLVGPRLGSTGAAVGSQVIGAGTALAANELNRQPPGAQPLTVDEILPMSLEASLVLDEINPLPQVADDIRELENQRMLSAPTRGVSAKDSPGFLDNLYSLNNPLKTSHV